MFKVCFWIKNGIILNEKMQILQSATADEQFDEKLNEVPAKNKISYY